MTDQNEGSSGKRIRNGGDNEVQEMYACKFCDKVFDRFEALGGHQNGHKKERLAQREQHLPNMFHNQTPVNHTPYRGNTYDLYTRWCNLAARAPTIRYHPYSSVPNSTTTPARVCPNPARVLYEVPVNHSTNMNEWRLNWKNNCNNHEHGSSSREMQAITVMPEEELDLTLRLYCETPKEKEEEELDLTLRVGGTPKEKKERKLDLTLRLGVTTNEKEEEELDLTLRL